MLVVFVHRC